MNNQQMKPSYFGRPSTESFTNQPPDYHTIPLPKTQQSIAKPRWTVPFGAYSAATLSVAGTRVVIAVSPEASVTVVTTRAS